MIQALAIFILLKGVWLVCVPVTQLRRVMQWWTQRPKVWLQGYGVFTIALGIATLLAATSP